MAKALDDIKFLRHVAVGKDSLKQQGEARVTVIVWNH